MKSVYRKVNSLNYSTEITALRNGHTPPINLDEQREFVLYIRTVLSNPTSHPRPKFANPLLQEVATSLDVVHENGGIDAAFTFWQEYGVPRLLPDFSTLVAAINTTRKLVHESELDSLPPTSYLISRELPNGLNVLFGASGSGKSFRALDYAEQIAQHGNVIYIAAEGVGGYDKRAKAWHKHYKAGRGGLHFWLVPVAMLDNQAVESFILAVQDIHPRLIVIDTLARCMLGGDENSARDMGLFIDACNRLQRELNTAVLVVHHTGKGNGSERGSSALRGAADAMIEVNADDGVIRVSCSKAKDSKPFETYYLKPVEVEVSPGEFSLVLLPSDRVIDDSDTLTDSQNSIIHWLASNLFDQGARTNDLRKAIGIQETTFYRALKTLSRKGLIEKDGRFDPWILTAAGKQYAAQQGYSNQV